MRKLENVFNVNLFQIIDREYLQHLTINRLIAESVHTEEIRAILEEPNATYSIQII